MSFEDVDSHHILETAVTRALSATLVAFIIGGMAALAAQAGAPKTYKGLEVSIGGVERTTKVGLTDCPPGANTVSSTAKPGEEFAVVTIKMKVLPAYKPAPLPRPTVTDASGKKFNTAVSFVDVGKVPEFSCAIPFRVPAGTALKSVQIEALSLDLP